MHDWPRIVNQPYDPGAARRGSATWWERRPRLHYWVVAPEHQLLAEPKRYLLQFLPKQLLEHTDSGNGRWWLKGDILIEFKSAHDPKMLVSVGLDGLWLDEADRMKSEAWHGNLRARVADKTGWVQATTTPLGRTWTYSQFEKPAKDGVPGYGFHTWRTVDNTRLPSIAAEAADAKARLPPQYYKREFEASREAFIGQIYADFDAHEMVVKGGLPKHVTLFTRAGGQDWGFSHPGAAIVVGADSRDLRTAHVWVVDERYQTNRLVEDWWIPEILKVNKTWNMNDWSCDPEAPDDIARYKDAGIRAFGHRNFSASKFDEHQRSVKAGIRMLASLMHQKRFHVLDTCTHLIEEIKSYRWKQMKGAVGEAESLIEEPEDNQPDHGCDALRYATTSLLRGANFEALGIAA
jgi:phage terminase large subunit